MKKSRKNKVIKKYQNRKLYDTCQSRYVTLNEIAHMIQRGENITVIDNATEKNITAAILTQIIFEKQKRSNSLLPQTMLKEIIKKGEKSITEFLKKSLEAGLAIINQKAEFKTKSQNSIKEYQEIERKIDNYLPYTMKKAELLSKIKYLTSKLESSQKQAEIYNPEPSSSKEKVLEQ